MNVKFTADMPTVYATLPEYQKLMYASGKLTKPTLFILIGKMVNETIEISKFVFPKQTQSYLNPLVIQSSVDKIIEDAKLLGMFAIGVGIIDSTVVMPSADASMYTASVSTYLETVVSKCYLSSNISQFFVTMLLKGSTLRMDVLSYSYPVEFRDMRLQYTLSTETKKDVDEMILENVRLYSYPTQTETVYKNTYAPANEVAVYKPSELVEKNPPMKDIT